jgi:hypothetical protein
VKPPSPQRGRANAMSALYIFFFIISNNHFSINFIELEVLFAYVAKPSPFGGGGLLTD